MSMSTRISALIAALGPDIKSLKTGQGQLSALATEEKSSLVGAVNEAVGRTPRITVGTTAPSSPSIGDIWIDTN